MYATNNERCTCAPGPPDYLCPSAPLLQVYLPHELYCTRYYKCTDGRAIEFQCPYGLYFDTQNNTCTCDFTQCYRTDPCIVFVDSCRCCNRQFENTGLAPENFYVCYNDGYAVATTCPVALDPCTGSQVQLQFVNQKCEVPPPCKFKWCSLQSGSGLKIHLGISFQLLPRWLPRPRQRPQLRQQQPRLQQRPPRKLQQRRPRRLQPRQPRRLLQRRRRPR
uniref:uncharacterized protein LOC120959633 n=1 Tax=Anopheles coluzzii TaxID=1518534 RepID=UPI0020FF8DC8|nr:uncharacterized protein LOC120959633 [Anopheles coluzzii]